MLLTKTEARDLEVFLRGLPARARDDTAAIRVLAQLFAETFQLPADHVIRRIAAQRLQ